MAEEKRLGKNAQKCLNIMSYGIKNNPRKELFPISSHYGAELFDVDKLKEYASKKMIFESCALSKEVTAESVSEAASAFGAAFSVEGSYGFSCGASVSASASAEMSFSNSTVQTTKFAQVRKMAQFAKLIFPNAVFRSKLRALVSADAKELLDSVSDEKSAVEAMDAFGPIYMHSTTFGALMTCTTSSTSKEVKSAHDLAGSLSAEISTLTGSGKGSTSFTMGNNTGHRDSKLEFTVSALGGDPRHILKGDEAKWIGSTANDLAAIDAQFQPISLLCEKGSKAEACLNKVIAKHCGELAKKWVGRAAETCLPLHLKHKGAKWGLQNLASGKFMNLDSGKKADGTKIHQWGDTCKYPSNHWRFVPVDDPSKKNVVGIQNVQSSKFVNLDGGGKGNGTKVHQWGSSATGYGNTNKWILHYVAADVVVIQGFRTDKTINLDDGNKHANGCTIHMWGTVKQGKAWAVNKWKMVRV